MIVSLFGPDGVGKSTISQALQQEGWFAFSGTGVASWPDKTWHDELRAQGIEDTTYEAEEHFLEKIKRAHELARRLEKEHGNVLIDSDLLHKTLMHDFLKGRDRFDELYDLAYPVDENRIHLLLYIDGPIDDVAAILQSRVQKRGRLEHFDPKSIDDSKRMIEACEQMKTALRRKGEKVITVETSHPVDIRAVLSGL